MTVDEQGRHTINRAGAAIGLGLIALLGFALWALIYRQVPSENQNALTLLIGILSANVGMVVGFYFGSSADNKKLAETVNMQAKTAQTAGAALGTSESSTTVLLPGDNATVEPKIDGATVITKHPGDGP